MSCDLHLFMTIERIVGVNNAGNMAKIIPQGTVTYITKAPTPTANYVVGPTGVNKNIPNPMAFASRNVRDTLYGSGSFQASSQNVNQMQKDVASALQISAKLNGNIGQTNLTAAQNALKTAASATTTAAKNAALANAKTALTAALSDFDKYGYNGKTLKTGNINIVGGEKSTKIVL